MHVFADAKKNKIPEQVRQSVLVPAEQVAQEVSHFNLI